MVMEDFEQYLEQNYFTKQYDNLTKNLADKKILLYGAGKFFNYIYERYDLSKFNIIGIADKKFRNEKFYKSYPVKYIKNCNDSDFDVMLVALQDYKSVVDDFSKKFASKKIIPLVKQYFLNHIQFLLTRHCNMNCVACSHFATISDKEFYSFETFSKDLRRIKEICPEVKSFAFVGGEPLLNKDISKMLELTRDLFPSSYMDIISNGLLVKSMTEDFWKTLEKTGTTINITAYPILENKHKEIEEYIKSKNVNGQIYCSENLINHNLKFFKRFNIDAKSDKKEAWEKCFSKNCHTLYNGYFGGCYFPSVADIANNVFNLDIDYKSSLINIHDENVTLDDILDLCENPQEICKYCDTELEHVDWYRITEKPFKMSDFFVRQKP